MREASSPVLVSACLLGVNCRYNGKVLRPRKAVMQMSGVRYLIPVCPEQLAGFPTPRPRADIVGSRVLRPSRRDVTALFEAGAEEALKLGRMFGVAEAWLKTGSPSCGAKGVTTRRLRQAGIRVRFVH